MTKKTTKIFQFKIQLNHIKPLIWRRVQISSTDTFADFHEIIQIVMGWEQCHLHEFIIKKNSGIQCISTIDEDDDFGEVFDDEETITINQVFREEKHKMTYLYDFGDGWEHNITLEKDSGS